MKRVDKLEEELENEEKKIAKEEKEREEKEISVAKQQREKEKSDKESRKAAEHDKRESAITLHNALNYEMDDALRVGGPKMLDKLRIIQSKIADAKAKYGLDENGQPTTPFDGLLESVGKKLNTEAQNEQLKFAAQKKRDEQLNTLKITAAVIGVVILTATAAAVLTMGMPTPYANIAYKIEYEKNEQSEQSALQVRAVRSEL